MSRKYCSVCGEAHTNPNDGLCNYHLEELVSKSNERYERLEIFLQLDENEKWEKLFDLVEMNGLSIY